MAEAAVSYATVKPLLQAAGLPVSGSGFWTGVDEASYQQWAAALAYQTGTPLTVYNRANLDYGFAYPAVALPMVENAVGAADYSATMAGTPLTGAHASTPVTWTLTETNGPATSYLWHLGDGTTQTTTVPHITYTYGAAGTFTATCVPSFNGVNAATVTAAAPAVLT